MADLVLQDFDTLVQNMAAQAQASAAAPLDLTTGSLFRAALEAPASALLWLQWQAVQIMAATRLASSDGVDVDSFVEDFDIERLPAVAATGPVTFARYASGSVVQIAPGTTVKTADGTQSFTVIADTTRSAWNATAGAYVMAGGAVSLTATVQAVNAGIQGNVLAGAVSVISSALPGVDTVTNAAPYANGADAESDTAVKSRFVGYINSLSRATEGAINAAVSGVQQGLAFTNQANAPANGQFTVTVDDGTGSPSSDLLASVGLAVRAVRAWTVTSFVQGPTNTGVTVAFTISAVPGAVKANLLAPAANATLAYINALPVGSVLRWSRIAQVAYDASPSISNVTSVLINGATSDVDPGSTGVVRVTGGLAGVVVS